MDSKKLRIYIASNVGIDYFFFLGKTLEKAGYAVNPIYSINEIEYRALSKSNRFDKLILRYKMYVKYPFNLFIKALRANKGATFIVTSNTFFAPFFIVFLFSWKKLKVIHLLYDLFPDAIEIAGIIKTNSLAARIIGFITKNNLSKCQSTVFLGDELKKHAEHRWGKSRSSYVIDISTDLSLYKNRYKPVPKTSKIVIHYGGQLGHLHSPNNIIECVKYIYNSDLSDYFEFNFYVSGSNSEFVSRNLSQYPIKIISAIPSSEWRVDIEKFHIGLVSLSPGGATVCLPSKTYGMMAGSLAILAIAPIWSDLAHLVISNDCGWVVNNSITENPQEFSTNNYLKSVQESKDKNDLVIEFYNTLKSIHSNFEQLEIKRINAFRSIRNKYDIDSIGKKWVEVINQV